MGGSYEAGLCSGFAWYPDSDVTLIRIVWLVAPVCGGVGAPAYPTAWIVMPSDGESERWRRRRVCGRGSGMMCWTRDGKWTS